MTPICNDVLTRVCNPSFAKFTNLEMCFRVGDKGDKNGMPYTIKGFGAYIHLFNPHRKVSKEKPAMVWMMVKYRGDKNHEWDTLLIGDTNSFQEKIVFGGVHPNPVFTHYLPKGHPQPL